ncbi:protein-tyrosine phosphatase-like protein [Baffinella frigidus]|nr:protein-tyrosine phosphatase-like protein [Cryptophyta sp. CCMP2293]
MGAANSREAQPASSIPSQPAARPPAEPGRQTGAAGTSETDYWKALGLIDYPDEEDEEDSDICTVMDGLFIGGMEGAADIRGLEARNITHVLNLSNYEQNPHIFREDKFQYLIINIPDRPTEKLREHWDRTNAFIREGLKYGNIYVHCFAGVSRAPSTVVAHLGMELEEALKLVRRARPEARAGG